MSQSIATSAALGRAMRGYRHRAGLSLLRTAAAAGIHPTYLSRLEHGRRHPSAATLDRLVVALGVPAREAEELRALAGHPPRDPLTPLVVIDPALAATGYLDDLVGATTGLVS
ncbi:MAG TPA: helix-turn-helix transcriptional regulator [Streptosporangiaceae bacterium]|nr:helix-turn-helix transcriptional regulator [Streptosporangiaceae bacterium]